MANVHRRTDLTQRERDVLAGAAEGLTNAAIAQRLGIGFETVRRHLTNVYDKTGTNSRMDAVRVVEASEKPFGARRIYECQACWNAVSVVDLVERPNGLKVKFIRKAELAYDLRQVCPSCIELLHDAIGAALARCKLKLPEAAQTT